MSTKKRNIRISSMVGGILFLAYATYVKVTGKFVVHVEDFTLFAHRSIDPFMYYLNLAGSLILGIIQLYRSFLFIPSNIKYWDEHPEYLKKRAEFDKSEMKVDISRLLKVTTFILLIFATIMLISKLF